MKTFDDLVFKPHGLGNGHIQAVLDLGNDIQVSVVGGPNFYGNGKTTFEVAAIYKTLNKFVPLPDDEDGIGAWYSKENVTEFINYLENL